MSRVSDVTFLDQRRSVGVPCISDVRFLDQRSSFEPFTRLWPSYFKLISYLFKLDQVNNASFAVSFLKIFDQPRLSECFK